ncbi:hypothetical protein KPL78_14850 [Roseomonas sp. HJA6]|uniref:Uncharacterized protein n=1 Tax=Roseomonas alba TaxID=2846776 RepID=A0ABS7AA11_9PROT|nr:hypothetical protein [Neoroseomonas alba]MBW6399138.1 hypothetical protein [Neoroseomonas alba]
MRRILALLVLLPLPVLAQAPPSCTAEIEGQTACMAGKLCECRFERGGQLTGRPDRFAWDCGVMRPMCPPDPTITQTPSNPPPVNLWLPPGGRPMGPR